MSFYKHTVKNSSFNNLVRTRALKFANIEYICEEENYLKPNA